MLAAFVPCAAIAALAMPSHALAQRMSPEASAYVDEAIGVMRDDALHRREIDFDAVEARVRSEAASAQTPADVHAAIKAVVPMLRDHHSHFFTYDEVHRMMGFDHADLADIKAGKVPHAAPDKLSGLEESLTLAQARMLEGGIAYIVVPAFDDLTIEGMQIFADRLQQRIAELDALGPRGWIVDLRGNDGGNFTPMVVGLGPLLDDDNAFLTVDAAGETLSRGYYSADGAYHDVTVGKPATPPILTSTVAYRVGTPRARVALLTGPRTASSAEAVVSIFHGQPNVAVIGTHTNGLTSVNAFRILSDGSVLNLTVGFDADRNGAVFEQGIAPDIAVDPAPEGSDADPILDRARDWIAGDGA